MDKRTAIKLSYKKYANVLNIQRQLTLKAKVIDLLKIFPH